MIDWHGPRIWQIATVAVSVVVVAVLAAGAVFLAVTNSGLSAELVAARMDTRSATANADQLYQQLLVAGIKPTAEKPAEAIAGKPGAMGDQGPRGFTGLTGADGINGIPGMPGAVGMTGIDGSSGTNGADSTTPGPQGPPGADSTVPGPAGPTGEAPLSWSYTDPAAVTYDCTRTTPFNPAAPTYSCTARPIGVTP